jgi:hypothetical protein
MAAELGLGNARAKSRMGRATAFRVDLIDNFFDIINFRNQK